MICLPQPILPDPKLSGRTITHRFHYIGYVILHHSFEVKNSSEERLALKKILLTFSRTIVLNHCWWWKISILVLLSGLTHSSRAVASVFLISGYRTSSWPYPMDSTDSFFHAWCLLHSGYQSKFSVCSSFSGNQMNHCIISGIFVQQFCFFATSNVDKFWLKCLVRVAFTIWLWFNYDRYNHISIMDVVISDAVITSWHNWSNTTFFRLP